MNMSFLWWLIDPLLGFFLAKPNKLPTVIPQNLETTTTEAGTEIRIIFGKACTPAYLAWYGNVKIQKRKVSSSGKK